MTAPVRTGLPPRVAAAELGWVLPGGTPISWDVLLELAIRRYWACRGTDTSGQVT